MELAERGPLPERNAACHHVRDVTGTSSWAEWSVSAQLPTAAHLRVLAVVDHLGYAGGSSHGVATYLASTLPVLRDRGVEACVAVLGPPHPAGAALQAAGVPLRWLGAAKWNPGPLVPLAHMIRQLDVDLLHLHMMKSLLLGRVAAALLGRPAVVHLHDAVPPSTPLAYLHRGLAPFGQRTAVVSAALAPMATAIFGIRESAIRVLHNCIDSGRFEGITAAERARLRATLRAAPEGLLVVVPGRLVPGKGQEVLLAALPRILREAPQTRVAIVGDGPTRPACANLAAAYGVAAAVTFTGYRRDLPRLLAAADLTVVPSTEPEGFCYVAAEAMAAGCAVVASNVGALPEIVADGVTGRIVPVGQPDALADAVLDLIRRPQERQRCAQNARHLSRRFCSNGHAAALVRLYREAIAEWQAHGHPAVPKPRRSLRI